jgi:hypothetical protein
VGVNARLQENAKAAARIVIERAPRLDLLRGRCERDSEGCLVDAPVFRLRDYLLVPIAAHCIALTRLLLSDHNLAVEQVRRPVRGQRRGVPHEQRYCRFCRRDYVEDALHALFGCESSPSLTAKRESFVDQLEQKVPGIMGWHEGRPLALLHEILSRKRAVGLLAWFAFKVMRVFDAEPLYTAD